MAKRVVRDWTDSEKVNALSQGAEVFFMRLIMKADDYGSYHANIKLLRSALFPLRDLTDRSVTIWLLECVDAGLIVTYSADDKDYLRILNFGQRMRAMRNTFPAPDPDALQLAATRGNMRPDIEREREREREGERERESDIEKEPQSQPERKTKNEIFEEIFSDELFLSELTRIHPKKNLQEGFEQCWMYHSQKPSPPVAGWEWRQKLSTWLANTKQYDSPKNKQQSRIDSLVAGHAKRHGKNSPDRKDG